VSEIEKMRREWDMSLPGAKICPHDYDSLYWKPWMDGFAACQTQIVERTLANPTQSEE